MTQRLEKFSTEELKKFQQTVKTVFEQQNDASLVELFTQSYLELELEIKRREAESGE